MKTPTGAWAFFEETRRASGPAISLAIALYALELAVSNLERFGPVGEIVHDLEQTTHGWIALQLAWPWIALCLVSVAIFGVGGLRAEDLGWRAREIVLASIAMVLFWVSVQVSLLVVVLHSGQEVKWYPWWAGRESSVIGSVLDQVLGTPFVEETFFRGFLLPQICLHASRALHKTPSLVAALLVSSTLFALSHVPRLLVEGVGRDLLYDEVFWILPWGLMLALVFLVTRNLFFCVGLHALWNARPTLIQVPWESVKAVWWVLTTVLVVGWCLGRIYRAKKNHRPPP